MMFSIVFLALINVCRGEDVGVSSLVPELEPYIINGFEVEIRDVPYQALVVSQLSDSFGYCGGSLISDRYVLTAAHCLKGADNATVLLGSSSITEPEEGSVLINIAKSELLVHPYFNTKNLQYDIALIRLPSPVKISENIRAIRMPKSSERNRRVWNNSHGLISGWGYTKNEGSVSPKLRLAMVNILNDRLCTSTTRRISRLNMNICTDPQNSAVCFGDSGDPLAVVQTDGLPTLVGITSYLLSKTDSCLDASANVFSFTGSHLDWIRFKTGIPIRR